MRRGWEEAGYRGTREDQGLCIGRVACIVFPLNFVLPVPALLPSPSLRPHNSSHTMHIPSDTATKKIEFAFDMHDDTADAIAHEMMEDLSLSAEEAQCIATKIRTEIQRISAAGGSVASSSCMLVDALSSLSAAEGCSPGMPSSAAASQRQSLDLRPAAAAATGTSAPPQSFTPQQHASEPRRGPHPSGGDGPSSRPPLAPLLPPASSSTAADHHPSPVSRSNLSGDIPHRPASTEPALMRPASFNSATAAAPASGGIHRSGAQTPTFDSTSGKSPSIYALIAAMKEVHEEASNASKQ